MEKQLVFRKGDVASFLGRENDTVCALFDCRFKLKNFSLDLQCRALDHYQRNYICRLCLESVCQLFIVRNEVRNVNIAVVLLYKDIFADLISVTKSVLFSIMLVWKVYL